MAMSRSPRRLLKDALASLDRFAEVLEQHADAREQVRNAIGAEQLAVILDVRPPMADAIKKLADARPPSSNDT